MKIKMLSIYFLIIVLSEKPLSKRKVMIPLLPFLKFIQKLCLSTLGLAIKWAHICNIIGKTTVEQLFLCTPSPRNPIKIIIESQQTKMNYDLILRLYIELDLNLGRNQSPWSTAGEFFEIEVVNYLDLIYKSCVIIHAIKVIGITMPISTFVHKKKS